MNIITAAVKRPIFTTMAILIVLVLGIFSLNFIPVDLMPELTLPVISVRTTYENASPADIEEQITKPLERAIVAVPGAEEISSLSAEGSSNIFIKFTWGTNLDEATNDIRDRIDRVISRLPEEVDRPFIQKFDTSSRPIMFLGVASTLHPVDLKRYIEDEISFRLERYPGVASASPFGGLDREIRVELDHTKVKALGLDLSSLVNMISGENITEAGGTLDRGRMSVNVRTKGEFSDLSELGSVLVYKPLDRETSIRLRDIADISDGWQNVTRITRVDGEEGQFMGLFKQSGANTVMVADNVNAAIEEINSTLTNVRINPIFDTSVYIKISLKTVTLSAISGGFLAILVILFFLQHIKSTLIISFAIPISIITTFMAMYFFNLTLNVVTIGALALGVGMLVDNSIVVLDNIFRLRSAGIPPQEAAIKGATEMQGPIVASTLTTLSVFMPLIFLTGIAGVLFRPFAFTICFALTASLLVSQTLVPMLAAKFLTDPKGSGDEEDMGGAKRAFGEPKYFKGAFKKLDEVYVRSLSWSLSNPWKIVIVFVCLLASSLLVAYRIGTEFIPRTDESMFRVILTMEAGTRVEETSETLKLIEGIVEREVPELVASASDIGGSGGFNERGSHKGEFEVRILQVSERERSIFEILDSLRPHINNIPGATVRLRADQSFIVGGGGAGGDRIQVELRGNDLEEAARLAAVMKTIMEGVPGVTDVYISNEESTPEELIVIDRERAADAGLTVSAISSLIKTAVGGSIAGYFRENGKEYDIRVKLKDSEHLSIDEFMNLPVVNSRGEKVILANVARAVPGAGPLSISRKNQARITTLNADFTDRSLGDVIKDMDAELKNLPMDREFSYTFAGEAEELDEAFTGLKKVLIMAIFLVYMVMACQFEQLRSPLVVMFSIPFAAIGVIWAHFLTNISFNINSFIGVIMLAGIVVNNAIILVDHANLLRRRDGMELIPALLETGRRRLRPILMTTLTTILGLLPMALGLGEGDESQIPLGRSVIGGLLSSSFITLFVIPCVYFLFFRRTVKEKTPEKAIKTLESPSESA
ncbi:MAG: efflux RND transporter permease subunit [Deltaproteobacteria bacterium]|jgi:HAE1 family hydrophobic/amphiphilic exporter-1|nr:efflux RND transporter permease subunit [Deltaproteobacteria bacterium]